MFKVIWLLRRKSGMSFEAFRDHYENNHSVLGQKYLGHLMVGYRRHYDVSKHMHGMSASRASEYDCITEWDMRDEAAFHEYLQIVADPVIGGIFREDSARFLDGNAGRLVICDSRDTGPGDGSETLRLRGQRLA